MPPTKQQKLTFVDALKTPNRDASQTTVSQSKKEKRKDKSGKKEVDNMLSTNDTEDWLSQTMKNIVSATSVEDIKHVCCDLISKVADMSTKVAIETSKKESLEQEIKSLRRDFTKFSVHYDEEIAEVKDEMIARTRHK